MQQCHIQGGWQCDRVLDKAAPHHASDSSKQGLSLLCLPLLSGNCSDVLNYVLCGCCEVS